MGLSVDWYNNVINITNPTTEVALQDLHDFIEDIMASPEGLSHDDIIDPQGKIEDPSNPGTFSLIIIILYSPWQIKFWSGSGYTKLSGGKLIGGLNNKPVAPTGGANDITYFESPVDGVTIVSGSGVTAQDKTDIISGTWNTIIDSTLTAEEILKILISVIAGKTTIEDLGSGLATVKFRDIDDTKDRIIADMDGSERKSLTIDKD